MKSCSVYATIRAVMNVRLPNLSNPDDLFRGLRLGDQRDLVSTVD